MCFCEFHSKPLCNLLRTKLSIRTWLNLTDFVLDAFLITLVRIFMKLLPEVCIGPRNNRLEFVNDQNHNPGRAYDSDPRDFQETLTRSVSRAKEQSFTFWGWSVYYIPFGRRWIILAEFFSLWLTVQLGMFCIGAAWYIITLTTLKYFCI